MDTGRFYQDTELADNLYPDSRGREDRWRYKNPESRKWVNFKEKMSVEQANALAGQMNKLVDDGFYVTRAIPPSERLTNYIIQYINYQESLDPRLQEKDSWTNRKYAMAQFAREFENIRSLEMTVIRNWWDQLTFSQQKLRLSAFRKFFNYLMSQGLTPRLKFNPFTTADDLPRLLLKAKPLKKRNPCNQNIFNEIRQRAGEQGFECLQIAMDISRYTTLREGDICRLKWEKNIVDNCLKVIVAKSEAQKGTARATRLSWDLKQHPLLKSYIDRARESSLINRRCPFVISHTPKRRAWNDEKEHLYQVLPERICRMFKKCRGNSGTTFHEIRGLSATLMKIAGNTNSQIQEIMSHESVRTTEGYQNAADLPYIPVTIQL